MYEQDDWLSRDITRRIAQFTSYGIPASRKQFGKEVGLSFVFDNPLQQSTKKEKEELIEWEIRLVEKFFYPSRRQRAIVSKISLALHTKTSLISMTLLPKH